MGGRPCYFIGGFRTWHREIAHVLLSEIFVFILIQFSFITDRVRSTRGYIFTLCVSSHPGEGGYLPSQVWVGGGGGTYLPDGGGGVPTQLWVGGGVPTQLWVGGVPTFSGLGRGRYLPSR